LAFIRSDQTKGTTQDSDHSNNLRKHAMVVLDGVHYMSLPARGGVWEKSVVTFPPHTQLIGLLATLPNAGQLGEWMESVTMRPTKLIEAPGARPIPLKYLFTTREGIFPLFRNPYAGPGSPMGLLGHRGDGVVQNGSSKSNKKNHSGFGVKNEDSDLEKTPRGLEINPALKAIARRRIQRVNPNSKMIQRCDCLQPMAIFLLREQVIFYVLEVYGSLKERWLCRRV
jgi:hypothetical protein